MRRLWNFLDYHHVSLYLGTIIVLGLLVVMSADAQEAGDCGSPVCILLEWEAPTERENGEPLEPDELEEFRIYHAQGETIDEDDPGEPYAVVPGDQRSHVMGFDLEPREQDYPLAFAATAVGTNGLESELSNVAVVHAKVKPQAPGKVIHIKATIVLEVR